MTISFGGISEIVKNRFKGDIMKIWSTLSLVAITVAMRAEKHL